MVVEVAVDTTCARAVELDGRWGYVQVAMSSSESPSVVARVHERMSVDVIAAQKKVEA